MQFGGNIWWNKDRAGVEINFGPRELQIMRERK